MEQAELIVCRDVSLGYEGQTVLSHLDLTVRCGDYLCVVGDNAADMMAAVEAVGQGGHVLVRNGEVVARIPLALGGLMSEGTAEDVAAQHDDFMVKARAMGIEPPLDPIMGIIFLPLPVIPTLRIRPEGMFDVTTFTYAD